MRDKKVREKISKTMREKGGNSGTWKKGMKAWNFKGGKKLRRKYKRFNGKNMLNAHVIWLKYNKLTEIPRGYVIHHKDGDSLNDNIENLILMEDIEHRKLHNRKGDALIHSPLARESKTSVQTRKRSQTPEDTPDDASRSTERDKASGTHNQQKSGITIMSAKPVTPESLKKAFKGLCPYGFENCSHPLCPSNEGCGKLISINDPENIHTHYKCNSAHLYPGCDKTDYTNNGK